jgi:hypothetical protein
LGALLPRLTDAGLVDLVMQPTCVVEARGAVLRELSRRLGPPAPQGPILAATAVISPGQAALLATGLTVHGEALYPGGRRPFADLWEAVDWISEHHPELDLDAPPQRAAY